MKAWGDKSNPVYRGFSCIKGRDLSVYDVGASRLLSPQRKNGDEYVPINYDDALDDIATRLKAIVDEHGPRSVACYIGTPGSNLFLPNTLVRSLMSAIGSPMIFTSLTIDQPGKFLAKALMGDWAAGPAAFATLDVALVVGANPVISLVGMGVTAARNIKERLDGGMKLLVVDPRETETATQADVYLQPRPGHDAAILAGIIRVIITEQLYDERFVALETVGFEQLAAAVEPFSPDMVADRAGIDAHALIELARTYGNARRGGVTIGTGPNMSGRGLLIEYLGRALMSICGHWPRAGEVIRHPGLFFPSAEPVAGTKGPYPAYGFGEKLRVRDFADTVAGLPTVALPDEILTEGDGQVRALIVVGGNPLAAMPNQSKTARAMEALDLLVTLDVQMSATSRKADYVIPAKLPFETGGYTMPLEGMTYMGVTAGFGIEVPYAMYAEPLVAPPPNADVHEEWEVFVDLARRMNLPLRIDALRPDRDGQPSFSTIEPGARPDWHQVWDMLLKNSAVPLEEIAATGRIGRVYPLEAPEIAPRPADWEGRLDVGNSTMMSELADELGVRGDDAVADGFTIIVRRLRQFHNSAWIDRGPCKRADRCCNRTGWAMGIAR